MQFDRLDALRKEKGVTATFLCSQVGKNRFFLKDCRTKKLRIDDEVVRVWADLLGTTPGYLLGETDIKEKPASISGDGLDPEVYRLILNLSRHYSAEDIRSFLKIADSIDPSSFKDLLQIVALGPEATAGLVAIAKRILSAPQS